MIERHGVRPAQLAELSSGTCGATSMRLLHAGQLSRHLLLIKHIADMLPKSARCEDALAVLDSARARDRDAATRVLSDPMVGAWLARAVRRLHGAAEPPADVGQLDALAAVTAACCGVDAELIMDRRGRTAMIPTMGLLAGFGDADQPLRLRVRSGGLTVTDGVSTTRVPPGPGTHAGRWQGLRRLRSWPGEPLVTATLDDVNPYRDIYRTPLQDRASAEDLARWQQLFADAWQLLSRRVAHRTAEIEHVLRTIVPLRTDASRIPQSVTARHAFGALGTTRPDSAAELAVTLVHETQHSKLNAILLIEPLFDPSDPVQYFAPWRHDARPVWGLFHGVYAFLAVADMMDRLRAEPAMEFAAEMEFAKVRGQLRPALDSLQGAPSLTDAGRRFAAGMERSLTTLEAAPVSRKAAGAAVRALNRNRARWSERNGRAG